jgi:hypothetical protein
VCARHGDVVFKAVLAQMGQQGAQAGNLTDCNATIHIKRIIGKFTFSKLGLDFSFGVIG